MRSERYRLTQRVLVLQLSSEGDERCVMPIMTPRRVPLIDDRSSQKYSNNIGGSSSVADSGVIQSLFIGSLFRNFVVSGFLLHLFS